MVAAFPPPGAALRGRLAAMTVSLDDPYLWLEDVTGDTALEWVRARNAETAAELSAGGRLRRAAARIRQVLDADDRIPYVRRHGAHLYNFWQDAGHPRGLWRRTTLEQYRRGRSRSGRCCSTSTRWRAAEGENWVWQGEPAAAARLRALPGQLSRGGADAAVVREFDLDRKAFVDDGFTPARGEERSSAGSTPTPSTSAPTSGPAR